MFKVGNRFFVRSTGCEIELETIIDREGKTKLDKPIYRFRYLNRQGKRNFTCYLSDIEKSIRFESWKLIQQND